jgi:hypothetical protein
LNIELQFAFEGAVEDREQKGSKFGGCLGLKPLQRFDF